MISDSAVSAFAQINWRDLLPDVIPTRTRKREHDCIRFYGELFAVYNAFDNWKRDHYVNPLMVYAMIHDDDLCEMIVEIETETERRERLVNAVPMQADFFAKLEAA